MAYTQKLETIDDLNKVRTSRSNYSKVIEVASAIITRYNNFVVIDPVGNYNVMKVARSIESTATIAQVKQYLTSQKINLNGLKMEFGDGSAGASAMTAITTAKQENATKLYCESFIEKGIAPSFDEIKKIYPGVDDDWMDSFESSAKALKKYLGNNNGYEYSREAPKGMMVFLEKIAKECGGVTTKDSWNPMDIVIVKANMKQKIIDDIQCVCTNVKGKLALDALNEKMRFYGRSKDLLGISLKKLNPKNKIITEWSDPKIAMATKNNIDLNGITLNWNIAGSYFETGELSFKLNINGKPTAMQVRSFSGKPREKNQFDMTQAGSSAKLGKVSGPDAIDPFLSARGMNRFNMRDMPKVGAWTGVQRKYWIDLFDSLSSVKIGGQSIQWGDNNNKQDWEIMLDKVIVREREATKMASQLSSKLQSLYFLDNMYKMGDDVMDFFETCYYGAKKQYQGAGVFLKISD
jgi:hypothetical protein